MDDSIDYVHIASQIYTRLEMEYGFATPKAQNDQMPETWKFLASQLQRHRDAEVHCWNEALNKISDEGNEFPPKIPKLLKVMRGIAWTASQNNQQKTKALEEIEYKKKVVHLDVAPRLKELAKKAVISV
jgi:hypothetical protein|tara:strand:+ start:134 stop:520 length:387 start_codon:yes stop_codon:yes gene_type:complete